MVSSVQEHGDVQKLAALIKDIDIAMLTTAMPGGSLRSRPMATHKAEFDGVLWFFTDAESGKVHEVDGDSHVNLSYADPDNNRYISVSGRASVVRDRQKARELWSPILKAWFPNGVDDPNIALLKVEVNEAEYWDGPSSRMVQILGMAKAAIKGERYHAGEHEKMKIQ